MSVANNKAIRKYEHYEVEVAGGTGEGEARETDESGLVKEAMV